MDSRPYTKLYSIILISSFLFNGCSSEAPELIQEEELITTVKLTFKSSEETQIVRWNTLTTNSEIIQLKANSMYEVAIEFLDDSDPVDIKNITTEVIEEANDHQVFYEFSGVNVIYGTSDSDVLDDNQNPLYINSIWNFVESSSGVVRIYLIHEPTSKNSSNRSGFGGETDIQVDIPLHIN
jgi:hypothetical protein